MSGIFSADRAGERLDVFLVRKMPDLSRSYAQRLIEEKRVTVDGTPRKANYKLRGGECVACDLPPAEEVSVRAENIPLDILYEDADIIVVNKPRGMVVHPAAGISGGTLVNALLYHCRDLSGINGALRPGIVHRLDMDTSGLMLAAKSIVLLYTAILRSVRALSQAISDVIRPTARGWQLSGKMENTRLHTLRCWSVSADILLLHVAWRRGVRIRFASI